MSNTKQVKQKLTRFFVIVVFLLILLFGIGFLGTKYITDKNTDTYELEQFTTMFKEKNINLQQLKKLTQFGDRFRGPRGAQPGKPRADFGLGRIEYIALDSEKQVLDVHVINHNDEDTFYDFIDHFKEKHIYTESGYVLNNVESLQGKFIFFKKMKYAQTDFFRDFFMFLLLDTLFCIVIYFIGKQFITRVFQPVEENIADMKNFVHNAGHELKTPITVMDSNLQLLTSMKRYDEAMFTEMKTELKNMNGLIDSLVDLSDISSFKNTGKHNVLEKIEEIIKHFSPEISEKNIKVKIDIPKNTEVEANKNYFSIFLINLIKNAIKYNKQDGTVNISFVKNTFKIADTGIGIEQKNLEKIFDRFYREEQARSKEGYGIGLSLVKKIADMYNWNISVKSNKGEGTSFEVKF